MTKRRTLLACGFLLFGPFLGGLHAQEKDNEAGEKYFETRVRPILQAHCFNCHGGEKRLKGSLDLTSRKGVLEGGDNGSAVDLKKPAESLLLKAVRHDGRKMPPRSKLPQDQVAVLAKWVEMGVPFGKGKVVAHGPPVVDEQAKNFWSFRPVQRPEVPKVADKGWVRNPIDAFILKRLEAKGLQPSPAAPRAELLRRVTYDLTGLPPTPEQVRDFLADASPDAYEKVVERLLASPHYGERWARHWLDLVRYAETNSFERDSPKPFVWRYRDYVIRSFNEDKPYTQFIREQLAGDELEPVTPQGIIATAYYRLGPWDDEAPDRLLAYYDDLDDVVSTTGQVFLGLTINCARCHDHKIDPIPQKDYYRFLAFFHGIQRYDQRSLRMIGLPEEAALQKVAIAEHEKRLRDIDRRIAAIEKRLKPQLKGGEKDDFEFPTNRFNIVKKYAGKLVPRADFQAYLNLRRDREKMEARRPTGMAQTLCVLELPRPHDTFVLARGNPQSKTDRVEPGFPSVLTDALPRIPEKVPGKTSGRRRALADWIAARDNPLTWRVVVNRVWQYHFGRGLVRSSSNYGYQGTPPTHPELLDWLADEFRTSGGRFKSLHRLMVLSNTYRMASRPNPEALAKDTENDLFWRFDPRRLSAEEIRDSILAVSGNINTGKMFGPSIYPPIPKEVLAGQSQPGNGWRTSPPEEAARRSVYVHIKRSLPLPILAAFDAPDPDGSCPVRFTTTQPTQALGLLNGDFLNEQAGVFAANLVKEAGNDRTAQVRLALWKAWQREPGTRNIERGLRFLDGLREENLQGPEALRMFCLLVLNSNEFMFVD